MTDRAEKPGVTIQDLSGRQRLGRPEAIMRPVSDRRRIHGDCNRFCRRPLCGIGHYHGIKHRFFGGFSHGAEGVIQGRFGKNALGQDGFFGFCGNAVGGGEAYHDFPAAVPGIGSGAGQAVGGAPD